jgi:hypothetical protein
VSQVQRPVHIREGEVPKPFGKLLADLFACEVHYFILRWGIGFEDVLPLPLILILLFYGLQMVPLAGLPIGCIISNRADDAKGGKHLGKFEGI